MKIIEIIGICWILFGVVVVAYVGLHYRWFLRKYRIRDKSSGFNLKVCGVYLASTFLSIISWPLTLIFYGHAEQERLDEWRGAGLTYFKP